MRLIGVMPIHGRPAITAATLRIMCLHDLAWMVVVGSGDDEIVESIGSDKIVYLDHPNQPLSNKVQYGVEYARALYPSHLMMCGSDSWIVPGPIDENADLIATRELWLLNADDLSLYRCSYKHRDDPMGAARIYSSRLLDTIDWQLFPAGLTRGLDWASWMAVRSWPVTPGPIFYEIKSKRWTTLTDFQRIVTSCDVNCEPWPFDPDHFNTQFGGIGCQLLDTLR